MISIKYLFATLYCLLRDFVLCFIPKRLRYKSIAGDVVLITGGGNGFGRCLALKLSKLVSHMVLWDIDEQSMIEVCELVKVNGCKCNYYVVNVGDHKAVYAAAKKVKQEVGKVDILINNAGVVNGKSLVDSKEEDIERTFRINTLAHLWLYKAFLPEMMNANYGHLVAIASSCSYFGFGQLVDYVGSKFAVAGIFESLLMEMRQQGCNGLNFTLVCPYIMTTSMFKGASVGDYFPAVDVNKAAEETIEAILTNDEFSAIPSHIKLVTILGNFSFNFRYAFYRIFNADQAMKNFTGGSKKRH